MLFFFMSIISTCRIGAGVFLLLFLFSSLFLEGILPTKSATIRSRVNRIIYTTQELLSRLKLLKKIMNSLVVSCYAYVYLS